MPRNRMIKPEFFESETLMRVSLESQLTFIGIWCHCDDYGCCMANSRRLLGQIYPLRDDVTEKKMDAMLLELVKEKLIVPIDYDGKKLFIVRTWFEHQKVQHPSKRRYIKDTDFEKVITHSLESHEAFLRDYVESHAPKRKKKEKEERESKEESKKEKESYAPFVFLTTDEFSKLVEKFGNDKVVKSAIEILNNYKASNGKKYKSDYHALIGWVYDKIQKENPQPVLFENSGMGGANLHDS